MDKEKLKKQIDGAYSMITGVYVKGADAKRCLLYTSRCV